MSFFFSPFHSKIWRTIFSWIRRKLFNCQRHWKTRVSKYSYFKELKFGNGLKLRLEVGNSEKSLQRGNPVFKERETNINKLHPHTSPYNAGGAVLLSLRDPCKKVKLTLRPCLHEARGPQVGDHEINCLGGVKKITLPYMQSYNPPSRGVLSQDYWMIAKHVTRKILANHVFWWLIFF